MYSVNHSYRESMAYQFYCIVGFVVFPFALWAIVHGQLLVSIPPTLTTFLCILNVYSFKRREEFWVPPLAISLMFIASNFIVIYDRGMAGGFWTYPIMLAIYWAHLRKTAAYGVCILFVTSSFAAYFSYPLEGLIRYMVTLFMTGVFLNIAAGVLEQQYRDLKELTITDHLTGAFNRRFMDQKIDELIERLGRNGTPSSLITLDVDHFKRINDTLGHSGGDQVLQVLVDLLQSRIRTLDFVCRTGGEEFVVILPDTRLKEARLLAEELRHTVAEETLIKAAAVTISCGVSELQSGDSRDAWLKRSDQALYRAKSEGRNRVVASQLSPQPVLC